MSVSSLPLSPRSTAVEAPFLVAVLQGVTWRKVLAAGVLGLAFAVLAYLSPVTNPPPHRLESQLILNLVGALFIVTGAVAADEAIRRGSRVSVACLLALLGASSCAAIVQWELRRWLGLIVLDPSYGSPLGRILAGGMEFAVLGGLGMMAYLQRQNAQRLVETIRTGQLRRAQAELLLIEANLTLARAQIDPGALLQQLAHIRSDYAAEHVDAEARLDALIQDLRTRVAGSLAATRSPELPS